MNRIYWVGLGAGAILISATGAQALTNQQIFFSAGSLQITPEAHAVVVEYESELVNAPPAAIVITGHCTRRDLDETDNPDQDPVAFCAKRAQAVADDLRAAGLPASVAVTVMGTPPAADDDYSARYVSVEAK